MNRARLALALLCGSAVPALADPVVLNFEGIASANNPSVSIGNFYNGGGGTNFGISFSPNALAVCLNTPGVTCSNASRGGQGDPASQTGGLFFLSGSQTYLDDAAGFSNGFSLFYSAVNNPGGLSVFSGLDGTGTLLATLDLPLTARGCNAAFDAEFCPFSPIGVSFSGVAQSIAFAGVENQIVFDDVTFGSATPGPSSVTPEPGSLLLTATGLVGTLAAARRRFLRA